MNDIIKVNFDGDRPTVLGRDLHGFLEVDTEYRHWFPRMCEYGFTEGVDFRSFLNESTGGRPAQEHQLTIDMAKEICMLQRNEKGKQARQYFIELEKKWNSPEAIMARALQMADKKLLQLQGKIEQDKPKVIFADAVSTSKSNILVGDLAKLIKQNGYDIGAKRLFEYLRQKGYLIKSGSSKNIPTQKSMELGLFEVKETIIDNPDGSSIIKRTPKVTGKGQVYFVNHFLGHGNHRLAQIGELS